MAGNQHWGHATSKDLYHWVNQKIAIFPSAPGEGIFSGSAVIDVNNTSGFFPNQDNGVVAIYTLNTAESETQQLAYSTDGGYTFTKYSDNPVLDVNSTQFRDPKVIWYGPTQKWVMVVAYAQEFVIGIYTSPDLKNWAHASNFSHHGLLGLQYECPNLVEIPMQGSNETMYLLWISINPGAPLGGSATQYFPGTFNGTVFSAVDSATRLLDFAKDDYAGQFFYGTPAGSDPISIDWANNWQYAQVVPTGDLEGWRSTMGLPKVNRLANISRVGYDLFQEPYSLSSVYNASLARNSSLVNGTLVVDYSTLESGSIYFDMNITNITSGTANFTFMSPVSNESISGGLFATGDFWLDRGKIRGFDNPFFTDKFSTSILLDSTLPSVRIEAVFDRTILEVFLNGGQSLGTTVFYPLERLDMLIIQTGGLNFGTTVAVEVWALEDAWSVSESNNTSAY